MFCRSASVLGLLIFAHVALAADKEVKGRLVIIDAENRRITISEQGKQVVYGLNVKDLTVTLNDKPSQAGLKDKALVRGAEVVLVIPESDKLVHGIIIGWPKEPAKDRNKAKPESQGMAAVVVKVDAEKMILRVKTEGKILDLTIGNETKFVGPKGGKRGTGAAGLKDTALKEGAEIQFVPGKKGPAAEEIRLPFRK
jgi:hypothetical protein